VRAATRLLTAALVATAAAALPASAGANNIWTAPDPATSAHWEKLTQIDCFAPAPTPGAPDVRMMSVEIVSLQIGEQLKFTGEVHDGNGSLLPNTPVAIALGRFRAADKVTLLKRPVQSNALGQLSFAVPKSELQRNTLIWAILPTDLAAVGTCSSKDHAFSSTVFTGVGDPLMVSVRPLLRVNSKFKTKGRNLTIGARLVAADVSHAGTVQLFQRVGSKWKKVGRPARPKGSGLLSFGVRVGSHKTSYQLVFTPRRNSPDYTASAERRFSITYQPPTPKRPKAQPVVSQGAIVNRPEPKQKTLNLPPPIIG
jgi:hypothetical protein